ncbi:MAG: Gfo/Idh/MocA family oxidoreductase [Verrucomicrobiales bacterium]|nr:Gfo/Idh/MocA family oxidoreductase [Verrucomicrobiales bacterium]
MEKPALAGIGSGGKGRADLLGSENAGCQVAALADVVDATRLSTTDKRLRSVAEMRDRYSQVPFYRDYREMLADMGDKIDAVTVSTPDHHHFHAAYFAMKAGKHVYCQKPLTHGLWEARKLAELAAETGVKTQMGNQAHAQDHMRRCVELIRAGVVGKVLEIHAWTNRPIWPQGFAQRPAPEPVPDWMDWEQWIGPAPFVEYSPLIAPFAWRGWWDYGCGALGDMACHIMDMGWWAMMPDAPLSVSAEQSGGTELSPPISSKITWQFGPGEYGSSRGFKFHWYDGYTQAHFDPDTWALVKESEDYNHPDERVLEGESFKNFGSVIVGEFGKLFFNRTRQAWVLKSTYKVDGFQWPEPSIPRAREQDNYLEWIDAIEGRVQRGQSDFSHAGPFTETILLGTLAQRLPGEVLEWDAPNLAIKGRPELASWIHREYRPGWEIQA